MNKNKKVYIVWIGWIWVSAIARYYMQEWYQVLWSDSTASELIEKLKKEWADIIIWEKKSRIEKNIDLVVYSEAIPNDQIELKRAKKLKIPIYAYPQALWQIANSEKLITVAWTHWKSTTTSLISLILKDSSEDFTSVVWTLLKEFDWKNFYHRKNNLQWKSIEDWKNEQSYFVIEACEYKRSFLAYRPTVWIITNIEIDHLDYYKDLKDYISAYKDYLNKIIPWGFAIINWQDINCQKLKWLRKDIHYIEIFSDYFTYNSQKIYFPNIEMRVPGRHILFDAKIAYTIWFLIWIKKEYILESLNVYNWVWRRMEQVWHTVNNNILISDYGHHPTEIRLTLEAIKKDNMDKKILTIFQPHQYNRTLELLDWFVDSFKNTDFLIIPNIYESRDSEEEMKKIDSKKLVELINHPYKFDWNWFENTTALIKKFDEEYKWELIIILLWAWDVDDLRYKIIPN